MPLWVNTIIQKSKHVQKVYTLWNERAFTWQTIISIKKKVFQMELAILFWSRWLHDFSDLAIILIIRREKRLHCCPPLNLPVASDPQLSSSPSPYALLLASHFPPTQPGIVGGLPTGNPGAPQGRISREKVKQWHTRTSPPDSSPI